MEHSGCLTNRKMAPLWYGDLVIMWNVKSSRKDKVMISIIILVGDCITGCFNRKFVTRDTIKSRNNLL